MKIQKLADLRAQLKEADAALEVAKKAKAAIVKEIMSHPEVVSELKEEGQTTVGQLKIKTGWYRHWDNDMLYDLETSIKPEFWPFRKKVVYTEDRKFTRDIEVKWPQLWDKLSPALSLTPKTPTIEVKEDSSDE